MYPSKNRSIFEKLRTRSFFVIIVNDIVAGSGLMRMHATRIQTGYRTLTIIYRTRQYVSCEPWNRNLIIVRYW